MAFEREPRCLRLAQAIAGKAPPGIALGGAQRLRPVARPIAKHLLGQSRVVPVTITNFSIIEEAFDPRLNPTRAKVDLGLKVLTFMEFPGESIGRDAYLAYQKQKEELADEFTNSSDYHRIRTYLPQGA